MVVQLENAVARVAVRDVDAIVVPEAVALKLGLRGGDVLRFVQVGGRIYLDRESGEPLPGVSLEDVLGSIRISTPLLGDDELDAVLGQVSEEELRKEYERMFEA